MFGNLNVAPSRGGKPGVLPTIQQTSSSFDVDPNTPRHLVSNCCLQLAIIEPDEVKSFSHRLVAGL
jgi:hypothetical protein